MNLILKMTCYKYNALYVHEGERIRLIREVHTSKVIGHFGIGKTIANFQRYVYYSKIQE